MSANAIIALVLLASEVGAIVGFVVGREDGFAEGVKCGRDELWVDDFIEIGKRDRERRDKQGRFARRATP